MGGIRSPGSRRGLVWESRGDCVGTTIDEASPCVASDPIAYAPGFYGNRVSDCVGMTINPGTDHILKLKVCQRSRKSHWPTVRLPTLMRAVPRMPGVKTPSGSSSDVITS